MMNKKWRKRMSGLVVTTLFASMIMPTGIWADTQNHGDQVPVLSTVPAANATVVRPDTKIQLTLDPQSSHYKNWNKKYTEHDLSVALITDAGEGVFNKENSDLNYDPATGTLTFTPPTSLSRYTTYDVVIGEQLPDWLRPKAKTYHEGLLPDMPKTQALEYEPSLNTSAQTPTSAHIQESSLLGSQGPAKEVQNAQDLNADQLAANTNGQSTVANTSPLPAQADQAHYIGPKPVHVGHTDWLPIDVKDGKNQKGIIESIANSQITLFGGQQFTVGSDTHIHLPEKPQSTLGDLQPGDFVEVTLNDHSQVQNVNVNTKHGVVSYVFTTGSDLHEPTHVTLQQLEQRPRVTDDGHFTLVSTDDYGLPAWGSETSIKLVTTDNAPLDSSAAVLPSATFTTSDTSGYTDVTVVDHVPQHLAAEISINGPNHDGTDAHGLLATFDFRPGLPAKATFEAPDKMEVGTVDLVKGLVSDIYGNAVEDGSELDLTASAGTLQTPVYTTHGQYEAGYTAAQKVQDVNLSLRSAEGNAMNYATIHLLPGDPATMTLNAPDKLQAGDTAKLTGDVYDRYGNTVLDGSEMTLTASAGTLPVSTNTQNGHFEVDYTAPTKVQLVDVAAASVKGTASADSKIQIIPGPPAILSLQTQKDNLYTQDTTNLGGQVADKYDNLIDNQSISLQAEHGTLSNANPFSDASGWYSTTYTAPFYNGVDTVNATAGDATASVALTISSAGTGINPTNGQVEKVASIKFDAPSYNATPNQAIKLTGHVYDANNQPLKQVLFSGSSASKGTLSGISYQTDDKGVFSLTYQAPTTQATATVTVNSNQISGTTTVNTLAYGYGYNPATGAWEPVGSITVDVTHYQVVQKAAAVAPLYNTSYNVTLKPDTTVQFTGHAYNTSGKPLAQVQYNTLTATAGTLTADPASDNTGAFTLTYQTPSTEGIQVLQIGSGSVFSTMYANISRIGQGYNPVTMAWEDVANITFNPNTYTVNAGSSIVLTGNVTNASGQKLRLAKVNISMTGGSANSLVTTDNTGSFTLTYVAPSTSGTYQVTGSVNNATYGTVSGFATINVTTPPPPHFVNPYLHLWGNKYYMDIEYSTSVVTGTGAPITASVAAANGYHLYLGTGIGRNEHELTSDLNSNGYVHGTDDAIYQYSWYSSDRYGYTMHYFYLYDLIMYQAGHTVCSYFYSLDVSFYYY